MRTALVYLLALAALAAGLVLGFPELFSAGTDDGGGTSAGPARSAPPVIVATAHRAPFADNLDALGTLQANESVTVTANAADHIYAIHFTGGQQVKAGELLVELLSAEERAQLAEATAIRDERKLTRQRVGELFAESMSSQRELDDAEAQLAAAEARVGSLRAAIDDHMVRAPFAGTLGLRRVSVGAFVQPSTVITTLDDLSQVKLDFTIPEAWMASVQPGMTIEAQTEAWPGQTFHGVVAVADTRLDPQTRSVTVRAALPNDDRKLRPGMLMKVRVDRGESPALQVPEEALIPVGDRQFVLRIDDDSVAHRTEVHIGRRRVGRVEVLDGIAEGDRVVIQGIVKVRPNSPVQVVANQAPEPSPR